MEEKRIAPRKALSDPSKADGVLLVLAGLALLLWPASVLHVLVRILGGAVLLYGAFRCVLWFRANASTRNGLDLALGLGIALLGLALLIFPAFFEKILFLVIGAVTAYGAVLLGLKLLRLRGGDRKKQIVTAIFGVALLALAVLIFVNPSSFGHFLLRLQGLALLLQGVSSLLLKPKK